MVASTIVSTLKLNIYIHIPYRKNKVYAFGRIEKVTDAKISDSTS